ncbi:MAG: hypothetical protein FJY67_05570 [Calditrichaeota bacterium]|nr:hypothetical protein [Calditrichota bacterium]
MYHFALPELRSALKAPGNEDQQDALEILISGHRLRDIIVRCRLLLPFLEGGHSCPP